MKKQNKIIYIIGIIVLITISIQFYWNYLQYNINKKQVVNEVQISLDNAVNTYYTELSKESLNGMVNQAPVKIDTLNNVRRIRITSTNPSLNQEKISINSQDIVDEYSVNQKTLSNNDIDSLKTSATIHSISLTSNGNSLEEMNREDLEEYISKVFISTKTDSLDLNKISDFFNEEILRKGLNFKNFLVHKNTKENVLNKTGNADANYTLKSTSNSSLLPSGTLLEVHYPNMIWVVLKKGLTGILLSSILTGIVVFILFYLLRIINKQKQISEIKNDFISNITHELKTPIATVTTAVEAMQNFNLENDPLRNRKYLDISGQQLDKLKVLVDKIMETSILESQELKLSKEKIDLIALIDLCIQKFKINTIKEINFKLNDRFYIFHVDPFHFENAISNLVENAIKYGGDTISVNFKSKTGGIEIEVTDNGNGISKDQQKQIFDKFYRVPNNNQHDIKGFGIGLYYTKNIIEKHNGVIHVKSDDNFTTFKIELWEE